MAKKRFICAAFFITVFIVLLMFSLIGLEDLIHQVILEGVVLAPETQDLWGASPGSSNTATIRNYTFYNLTNPRKFIYNHQKPRFHEITNYLYQQRSNFTNIRYTQDKSIINYDYWLYFTLLNNSRSPSDKISIINLAPIGFWSQLGTIDISTLAIQGFGGLFVEMNNTIKSQAIGQGVAGQYLSNYSSFSYLCSSLFLIGDDLCSTIYYDPNYGFSDINNYDIWVDWSYYNNKEQQMIIYDYFGLKKSQLMAFDKLFQKWCYSIDNVINNWYCGGEICQNYDLTILQLSSYGVTNSPPSGPAMKSICQSGNVTCVGYPELYSFYTEKFLKQKHDPSLDNLTFSKQTTSQLFRPYTGTLLNVGNLSNLFSVGQHYDKNKDAESLEKLVSMTHAQTSKHAIVIWEYTKYFAYEFVIKSKEKGTNKIAGLGGVFSQALYQSFIQFSDWIMEQFLSILVAEKISNCTQFLNTTTQLTMDQSKKLCKDINSTNYKSYYKLIQPCENQYYLQVQKQKSNLTYYYWTEICDKGKLSVSQLVQQAHQTIQKKYNCTMNSQLKRCNKYQLGIKQFIDSSITLDPIENSIKTYQPSTSGKSWNNELQEWQYSHFLNEVYGDKDYDKSKISNFTQLIDLLSFDKFFSGPMIQNLTLVNDDMFKKLFYWENRTLLQQFIRFVTIEVGFGGFVQKRSVTQLLFGYQDQFLKGLKEMDIMLGGDPSINTIVALNQLNSTLEGKPVLIPQSMYTGYSDPLLTRIYTQENGKDYIAYNRTYFDGYNINSQIITPFREKVYLKGTDAVQNKPMSFPDQTQYIFIDSLYRVGELDYLESLQRYGFDLLRYRISNRTLASCKDYPPNINFNQYQTGFMNLSFLGLPILASKSHFLGADQKWADKIEVYDEKGEYSQVASHYDESEVVFQPLSGATFTATLYLQTNIIIQNDILFTNEPTILPVYALHRSGNMSEQTAQDLLGDLKFAIAFPRYLVIACIFGITAFIIGIFGCIIKNKPRQIHESLLQSRQNVDQINEAREPSRSITHNINESLAQDSLGQNISREMRREN